MIGRNHVVTFPAGFQAQQLFGFIDTRRDPGGRAARHRPRRAGKTNFRNSRGPKFFGMAVDPVSEFTDQEIVNGVRILMRHRFAETAVERQRMTRGAMLVIIDRFHVLPAGGRSRRRVRRSIRPRLGIAGPVTVGTDESYISGGTAQLFLQMNGVVEFDGSLIALLQRREFRMAARKGTNGSCNIDAPALRLQIAVARYATRAVNSVQPVPRMVPVAIDAVRSKHLIALMYRSVVTGRACLVRNLSGEDTGTHVTHGALPV